MTTHKLDRAGRQRRHRKELAYRHSKVPHEPTEFLLKSGRVLADPVIENNKSRPRLPPPAAVLLRLHGRASIPRSRGRRSNEACTRPCRHPGHRDGSGRTAARDYPGDRDRPERTGPGGSVREAPHPRLAREQARRPDRQPSTHTQSNSAHRSPSRQRYLGVARGLYASEPVLGDRALPCPRSWPRHAYTVSSAPMHIRASPDRPAQLLPAIHRSADPGLVGSPSHCGRMPTELQSRDLVHTVDAIELPPLGAPSRGARSAGTYTRSSLRGRLRTPWSGCSSSSATRRWP